MVVQGADPFGLTRDHHTLMIDMEQSAGHGIDAVVAPDLEYRRTPITAGQQQWRKAIMTTQRRHLVEEGWQTHSGNHDEVDHDGAWIMLAIHDAHMFAEMVLDLIE